MKTLDAKELAAILHLSPYTVRSDAIRRPERLPPSLVVPGSRRRLWLEEDVDAWLNRQRQHQAASPTPRM
jgi:predicted DNA-binding transcriptional regulator AlpA